MLVGYRLQVLSGLVAGAGLALAKGAMAAGTTPVDLFDKRKVRETGFDLIYEAREDEKPIALRDGLTQYRSDLKATVARVKASEARLDGELEPSIKKNYW